MSPLRLPRKRPGEAIRAEDWNTLCDAIDRASIATVAGGLETRQRASGTTIWAPPTRTARVAYTTSSISARIGSILGYGSGDIQVLNPTTRDVSGAQSSGQTLLNLFDQAINPGHYVTVVPVDSAWLIVATDSCSAIATGLALGSFDFLMTTQASSQPGTEGSDPGAGGADLVDPTDWLAFVNIEI